MLNSHPSGAGLGMRASSVRPAGFTVSARASPRIINENWELRIGQISPEIRTPNFGATARHTFTQKAAFELRDRVSAVAAKIGYTDDLSSLRVGTIPFRKLLRETRRSYG